MAETDLHRDLMVELIQTLQDYYAGQQVYVSGNLLVFYEPGNRRKYLAPDVFVVKGVSQKQRKNYLIWEEGRGPDMVIELTSSSTRHEDVKKKMSLYRDVLCVPEYFLFDPNLDYLVPPLQGYRLWRKRYVPIKVQSGRLPSEVLGLHLERDGRSLRLYDPINRRWLLTPKEQLAAVKLGDAQRIYESTRRLAEEARIEIETVRRDVEAVRRDAAVAREREEAAQAEIERLRRELEQLKKKS